MKITFCAYDTHQNIDGPTAWIKRLLPYLRTQGIETRILFFATNHKELTAYNHFKDLGFQCRLISWNLYYDEKVAIILDDIKNHPPDIFIPNYFPFALGASQWIKESGIPVIMALHNDNAFHYELVKKFSIERDNVAAVVSVSKLMTENVFKNTGKTDDVYFIPYGAPVPSKVASPPSGKLKLVYAGRIQERQKRITELVRAFCKVAKETPGTSCTIYGSGSDEPLMKKVLADESRGLEVEYRGRLESNQVQQYLLEYNIFVLLSDFEGLPISLMEAMACGLVPVCLNIKSGIPELIEDGVTGILVNDRGADFVKAIQTIKAHPEKWQAISKAAREKIINEYSTESCNKKWLDLLYQLHDSAGKKKELVIPSKAEIKKSAIKIKEFKGYCDTKPFILLLPFYKLKRQLGILKRKYFPAKH